MDLVGRFQAVLGLVAHQLLCLYVISKGDGHGLHFKSYARTTRGSFNMEVESYVLDTDI